MLEKKKIEFVIPVYNEEGELEENTLRLKNFLEKNLKDYFWRITIADNASTDKTEDKGRLLSQKYPSISYLRLEEKGRGRAVKKAWGRVEADVYSYMDIDLSTDLKHVRPLIEAIFKGYDIAIGSRLLPDSRVIGRTLKREILSRGYNLLIKILFGTHFSDAQCGFKAVSRKVVKRLLPKILDNEWFFDSELLIVSEKLGFKIYEEPVFWTDNPGSTVRVLKTVIGDLKGLLRLLLTRPWKRKKGGRWKR